MGGARLFIYLCKPKIDQQHRHGIKTYLETSHLPTCTYFSCGCVEAADQILHEPMLQHLCPNIKNRARIPKSEIPSFPLSAPILGVSTFLFYLYLLDFWLCLWDRIVCNRLLSYFGSCLPLYPIILVHFAPHNNKGFKRKHQICINSWQPCVLMLLGSNSAHPSFGLELLRIIMIDLHVWNWILRDLR